MQSLLRLAFPPQCISCGEMVDTEFGLCGECWRDTPFITGQTCHQCGVPLPDNGADDDDSAKCDDCISIARPWQRGASAMAYSGAARKLILSFKHGDRMDLVHPLATWMAGIAGPMLQEDTVFVPIPIHGMRLLRRRYNQAALLSNALAKLLHREAIPDLLVRSRNTDVQDGMDREARFKNQQGAIRPAKHAALRLAGRPVLLVDDVMTSGATLAAAAEASHAIGARRVDVLTLARVVKDP